MKEEILPILEGIFYIATAEGDQPRVRPFDGACIYGNKLYIGTNDNKDVYAQMVRNPKVEIFAMGENGMLRIAAEADLESGKADAAAIYEEMGKDPAKENLAVVELKNVSGMLTGTDGAKKEVRF